MTAVFDPSREFAHLSLTDLLEARNLFHNQLLNKKNVVATALGLYRIRKSDIWPTKRHPVDEKKGQKGRRTLFNSQITPYSWPSIYVFISEWESEAELAKNNPTDVIPKSIALPDGRAVPLCVIEALIQPYSTDLYVDPRTFQPRNFLVPGSPIVTRNGNGPAEVATAGCIVRDGARYFALSNRHAIGEPGTEATAIRSYSEVRIGQVSELGLTRSDFKRMYPRLPSERQYSLMDIGLIELDDVRAWRTEFGDIAPIGSVLDLYDSNFTLQLIGKKVVGIGAVSGKIRGEIHGLFYRYKSLGGFEYVSDFLVGPETNGPDVNRIKELPGTNVSLNIHHGDSGTLLFLEDIPKAADKSARDPPPTYYPFAILWGRHQFLDRATTLAQPYGMAVSLSGVLNELNVDFVRGINLDNNYVWGYVGHYAIGARLPLAIDLLKSPSLKSFVNKNVGLLTLSENAIVGNDPKVIPKDASGNYDPKHPAFVQLADVPDNVWKKNVNVYMVPGPNGKKIRKQGPGTRDAAENANHFADIDLPYKGAALFLDYVLADLKTRVTPSVWLDYYKSHAAEYAKWTIDLTGKPGPAAKHWGALPFRVEQLFDEMVGFAKSGKEAEFLCAGGVLIHYLGDACQPLHASYLSQGDPNDLIKRPKSEGMKMRADGVHSGYEDGMVEYGYSEKDLMGLLAKEIKRQQKLVKEQVAPIANGKDAAKAVVLLIKATRTDILPVDIVNKWLELKDVHSTPDRNEALWAEFGQSTVRCMARGTRYLAAIWQGAWTVGGGTGKIGAGKKLTESQLSKLYNNPNFIESKRLDKY